MCKYLMNFNCDGKFKNHHVNNKKKKLLHKIKEEKYYRRRNFNMIKFKATNISLR